jgi:hypothetical protein
MFVFYRMQSVQNLGLALISLLTGIIVDNAGYFILEMFFLSSLCSKYSNDLIFKTQYPVIF